MSLHDPRGRPASQPANKLLLKSPLACAFRSPMQVPAVSSTIVPCAMIMGIWPVAGPNRHDHEFERAAVATSRGWLAPDCHIDRWAEPRGGNPGARRPHQVHGFRGAEEPAQRAGCGA